jgi:acetolactate synthase small subunit
MRWTYQITAASRPRVLMRLVQVFDQQALVISSLQLALLEDRVKIRLTVTAEPELAHRVRAKLCNLTDILDVDLDL